MGGVDALPAHEPVTNDAMQVEEEVLVKSAEAMKDVAMVAGEFVDKMGNDTQTKTTLSPEERKKKMEELRKRMVNTSLSILTFLLIFDSENRPKPIERQSSKKQRRIR